MRVRFPRRGLVSIYRWHFLFQRGVRAADRSRRTRGRITYACISLRIRMRVRVRCGVRMRRWCGYGPYAAKINFMSMLSFSSVHHSGRRHIWVVSATRAERPYVNIYCSSSIIIFLLLGARRPRQSRDPPLQTPSPYDLPCSPCCSGRPHALTVAPLAPPAPLAHIYPPMQPLASLPGRPALHIFVRPMASHPAFNARHVSHFIDSFTPILILAPIIPF